MGKKTYENLMKDGLGPRSGGYGWTLTGALKQLQVRPGLESKQPSENLGGEFLKCKTAAFPFFFSEI